jgi:hypothetical protein
MPGINRIFNIGMVLLLIVTPFIKEFKSNRKIKVVYFILLTHFVLLLLSSPQFRFFLPEFVFLFVLILKTVCSKFNIEMNSIRVLLMLLILIPLILIELIDYKNFTNNKLHQSKSKFNLGQLIIPEKNSKYPEMYFEKIKEGNLHYYSPKENFFFFGTANGDLPCVNKVQLEYFKQKFHYIPQMRTKDLKDGFYSKKVSENE